MNTLARPVIRFTLRPRPAPRLAGSILFRFLLCDRPWSLLWFLNCRAWRFARRRALRYFPWAVPRGWSR